MMRLRFLKHLSLPLLLFTLSCGKKSAETKLIRKDITETVFASGVLEAQGTYNLNAQVDGYLRSISFNEGDTVQEGAVLAVIENHENLANTASAAALYEISRNNTSPAAPALAQARANIVLAKDRSQLDSAQAARYSRLWTSNSIARTDYENMQLQYQQSRTAYENAVESYRLQAVQAQQQRISAQAQKEVSSTLASNNQIRALVRGRVYQKAKQVGDYVRKGDVIAVIGNAEVLYAKVSVDESNIGKVAVGQNVRIGLNTNPNKVYSGHVAEIYPAFDEATQSFFCKIFFDAPLDFRISGTQLQANIIIAEHKNALLIPRAYLDFNGRVQIKGQKDPVKVQTGIVSSEWVEVLGGLDRGATLVTENVPANHTKPSETGQLR